MTEPVTIRLEPSGDSFTCGPGETILRAGLAAGFAMPYECASGSCSSCKGRLLEGAVEHIWPDATGLSERDRRKGDRILCCQALPAGRLHRPGAPRPGGGRAGGAGAGALHGDGGDAGAAGAGRDCVQLPAGAAGPFPARAVRAAAGTGRPAPRLLDGEHGGGDAGLHRQGEAGRPRLALSLRRTRPRRYGEPGGALRPGLPAYPAGA